MISPAGVYISRVVVCWFLLASGMILSEWPAADGSLQPRLYLQIGTIYASISVAGWR